MYEARFRLKHDCAYRDLSERFPEATVREWYHSDCQVLEVTAPDADGVSDASVVEAVEGLGDVLHVGDGDGVHVVAQSCECSANRTVVDAAGENGCIHVPPTVYREGWEVYTVVGFERSDVRGLLDELGKRREVDVVSKKHVEERSMSRTRGTLFTVDGLFAGMTGRQIEALRVALDNGYYDEPRGASVEEMARETTVARATFEEHLRKAENRLVSNLGGFVRLLSETEGDGNLRKGAVQAD